MSRSGDDGSSKSGKDKYSGNFVEEDVTFSDDEDLLVPSGSNFSQDVKDREAAMALKLMEKHTSPKVSSTESPLDVDDELNMDRLDLSDRSDDEFGGAFMFEEDYNRMQEKKEAKAAAKAKAEEEARVASEFKEPSTTSASSTAQAVNGNKNKSNSLE